ncbi:hypothetical protein C1645_812160 [Glomus cerebriforme]|uniref:Uncharacterized protein n=1 Tax=Glomus cerebriforme TaxID=658196 RepID=A0A397TPL2_9GLOM|nr:hypothetical protein C1645_812160 [Glomus cerebriforme]
MSPGYLKWREFSPRDIIGSKLQQHRHIRNYKKCRKLDHLIDSTGDCSGGGQFLLETPEFSSIDWNSIDFIFITNYNHMLVLTDDEILVLFFGDSVLQSRTHSQPGFTNIFTGVIV